MEIMLHGKLVLSHIQYLNKLLKNKFDPVNLTKFKSCIKTINLFKRYK